MNYTGITNLVYISIYNRLFIIAYRYFEQRKELGFDYAQRAELSASISKRRASRIRLNGKIISQYKSYNTALTIILYIYLYTDVAVANKNINAQTKQQFAIHRNRHSVVKREKIKIETTSGLYIYLFFVFFFWLASIDCHPSNAQSGKAK